MRAAVGAALIALIAGCMPADTPAARFSDYLDRLARTLDSKIDASAPPDRRAYPDRRDLLREIDQPRTGWIGLFQLHRCGVVNLVAERNSILGRVAPPQARLAYESRLLQRLHACRGALEPGQDPAFAERLDELIERKRAALGPTIWNLTWASDSITGLFNITGTDAGLEPSGVGRETRQALARLGRAVETIKAGKAVERDTLGPIYETLDKSAYGGRLQIAALEATAALKQAAAMIDARLARRPVCFNAQPNRRARTLRTILMSTYADRIQPYLADLVRAGRLWRSAVNRLMTAQTVEPGSVFHDYYTDTLAPNAELWARLDRALTVHTDRWQTLLGQCRLMPGT